MLIPHAQLLLQLKDVALEETNDCCTSHSYQPVTCLPDGPIFPLSLSPFLTLVFCSRDVGSAVPPRVAPSIFYLRGESGAYSQAPLLPPAFRGGTVLYCTVLYCTVLYCTVRQFWCHGRWYERPDLWIQLAVHRRCHWLLCRYNHSTPGLLTASSLTSMVWVHPRREAAGVASV